jgi:hypothetical protein
LCMMISTKCGGEKQKIEEEDEAEKEEWKWRWIIWKKHFLFD